MNESVFNDRVESTLLALEDVLDLAESDLDYDTSGGVLTVRCESGAQVIFTRQTPVLQLWVAAPTGGFHFDYDEQAQVWRRDSDHLPLSDFLSELFADLCAERLPF